jgi:hypothetical protein
MSLPDETAQTLLRLAETLERAARQLRELAGGENIGPRRKAMPLADGFVEQLQSMERSVAAQQLSTLTHKQLADLYSQLGGASAGKKRGKDWLLDRVLWQLFDFHAGPEIIKGSRS